MSKKIRVTIPKEELAPNNPYIEAAKRRRGGGVHKTKDQKRKQNKEQKELREWGEDDSEEYYEDYDEENYT